MRSFSKQKPLLLLYGTRAIMSFKSKSVICTSQYCRIPPQTSSDLRLKKTSKVRVQLKLRTYILLSLAKVNYIRSTWQIEELPIEEKEYKQRLFARNKISRQRTLAEKGQLDLTTKVTEVIKIQQSIRFVQSRKSCASGTNKMMTLY